MELLWTCHEGNHLHISGYFHNPTEPRHWETLKLMGEENIITIKGLEGGIDISIASSTTLSNYKNNNVIRKVFNPRDFECSGKDMEWNGIHEWQRFAVQALNGEGPLNTALTWNAGIYLFYAGLSPDIQEGIDKAKQVIKSGLPLKHLEELINWRQKNYD